VVTATPTAGSLSPVALAYGIVALIAAAYVRDAVQRDGIFKSVNGGTANPCARAPRWLRSRTAPGK